MILCNTQHIEVSREIAEALASFARKLGSKDTPCPAHCVGVSGSHLSATDGHRAVTFYPKLTESEAYEGRSWTREYVETQIKISKAVKSPLVKLLLSDTYPGFAPVFKSFPAEEIMSMGPQGVALSPKYLSSLDLVCKACDTEHVVLSQVMGPLDPVIFTVSGQETAAKVIMMPVRQS